MPPNLRLLLITFYSSLRLRETRQSFRSAHAAYIADAACSAYCAKCAWTLASDFAFVSFSFRFLLLGLRFLRFFVSRHLLVLRLLRFVSCSPCSSVYASCPFVVFFLVFASFSLLSFVVFFVVLRLSSFVCFFSLSPSDLVLRSALEDGGLHVDFRLPVVFFLLLRRLRFTSRSLSASTDAGDLVSDIGTLSIVVRLAKPQAFSSARVA